MFCPNCGEKLDDDDTFCSECGFDIKNNKTSTKSSNESLGNKNIVIGGLIIVAILILVVGIASLNSSNLTINGVNFNIPSGFEENVNLRIENESLESGGAFYASFYKDNNGNMINLGVLSNMDYSPIDDFSFDETHNAVKKNIGGKEGWLGRSEFQQDDSPSQYGYFFSYLNGENEVIIYASDEHLIEEVIV